MQDVHSGGPRAQGAQGRVRSRRGRQKEGEGEGLEERYTRSMKITHAHLPACLTCQPSHVCSAQTFPSLSLALPLSPVVVVVVIVALCSHASNECGVDVVVHAHALLPLGPLEEGPRAHRHREGQGGGQGFAACRHRRRQGQGLGGWGSHSCVVAAAAAACGGVVTRGARGVSREALEHLTHVEGSEGEGRGMRASWQLRRERGGEGLPLAGESSCEGGGWGGERGRGVEYGCVV